MCKISAESVNLKLYLKIPNKNIFFILSTKKDLKKDFFLLNVLASGAAVAF